MHLRQTFEAAIKTELYPRSQIDIFVEVLQADAGIPLRDYVTACTASLAGGTGDSSSKPMVDVSNLESSSGGPELTVAALPKTGEIVLLEMSQRFHVDHLEK